MLLREYIKVVLLLLGGLKQKVQEEWRCMILQAWDVILRGIDSCLLWCIWGQKQCDHINIV